MKKILLFVGVALITSTFIFVYTNLNNDYQNRIINVDRSRIGGNTLGVDNILNAFSHFNYSLPDNLLDISSFYFNDQEKKKAFINSFFNDSLAQKTNSKLLYVPLYNRKTNKKEAFLLISAGIDGKLNSSNVKDDTIYEDSFLEKFEFYNKLQYQDRKYQKFNLCNYLFGSKDYLVWYYNCYEENMKNEMPRSIIFFEKRHRMPQSKDRISIVGTYSSDTLYDGVKNIILKSWDKKAICKFRFTNNKKINIGDTLAVTGFLENIDQNGTFHLEKGELVSWDFIRYKSRFDSDR